MFSASAPDRIIPTCKSMVFFEVRFLQVTIWGTASGPVTTRFAIAAADLTAFSVDRAMSKEFSGRLPSAASWSVSESTAAALASARDCVMRVLRTVQYLELNAASQYSQKVIPDCSCAAVARATNNAAATGPLTPADNAELP